jgi:uncharacterized protein YndB with AHSA1/START domain
MTEDNETLGCIEYVNGYYVAKLERVLEQEQNTVWSMLTDPSRFVEWLAPGKIELRKGGSAKLNFEDSGIVIDSIVSEFDPPQLLEYSWSSPGEPTRPLRWETEAIENGTRLALTLRSPADEDIARFCAGWEAHLMMLMAAIEGIPIKFPFDRFTSTREAYRQILSAWESS